MPKALAGFFIFMFSCLAAAGFFSLGMPILSIIAFIALNALSFLALSSKSGKKGVKRKARLEQQFNAYFLTNVDLQISDHVSIKVPKSGYQNFDELDVYYQEDLVCKFHEFDQYFPETYQVLIKKLENSTMMAKPVVPDVVKQEKVVEESVMEETNESNIISGFIQQLDEYNVDIVDETISAGLYNTTSRLKQLVLLQEKYPKTNRKLVKLTSHYLPILIEILKNYCAVRNTHANQNEIVAMEEKLNKTIILINEAIKNITSSLFQEEMMNLSADMTVLENILKNDGLIDDEMNMDQLNKMVH